MTRLWTLEGDGTDACILFEKREVGKKIAKEQKTPIAVRRFLNNEYSKRTVPLILSGNYEEIPFGDPRWNVDFVSYGWISVFSERAHSLFIEHGSRIDDFLECHFKIMPSAKFYLYLPQQYYDVVDMKRSNFHMILPTEPPLPIGISSLVVRPDIPELPECFFPKVPGHEMVFGDLLVSDSFFEDWKSQGLTGAAFREVTKVK